MVRCKLSVTSPEPAIFGVEADAVASASPLDKVVVARMIHVIEIHLATSEVLQVMKALVVSLRLKGCMLDCVNGCRKKETEI